MPELMQSTFAVGVIGAIGNIDGKTIGNTSIMITPAAGGVLVPTAVVFRETGATSVTTGPTVSVGSIPSSYTDLVPATVLGGVQYYYVYNIDKVIEIYFLVGGELTIRVSVGAVATSYPFKVSILGYYDPD